MNAVATRFLQTYAAAGEPEEGWMFGKALQQARLDFSAESLVRLDALLTQIRERAKPSRAELDSPQGRNFQSLLAFYVMELVHRISRFDLVWHDHASALRALPPGTVLQHGPSSRLVALALDQQLVFQPLAWLEAQLLPEGRIQPSADYVAGSVAQLERVGRAELWEVAHAAGRIASWQMQVAANGRQVMASMASQKAHETLTVVGESTRPEDQPKAIDYGIQLLDKNPDGALWQVLAFDGFHDQEGVRNDAIIVVATTYGEKGARLVMAFPYRRSFGATRFEILRPQLRESNLTVEKIIPLNVALERGLRSIQWVSGGSWDQLYKG